MKQVSLVCMSACLAGAPAAYAQVDTIVVTAQRREEDSSTVPISLVSLTSDTLQAAGVGSTEDLYRLAPGLQIGRQLGGIVVNVRGVGAQTGTVGDEASVPLYIDGFYVTDARAMILELNSIDRVEVLRGPQGTLFGRNSVGGLVQIVTRDPLPEPSLETSVGYGSFEALMSRGYATSRVGDGLNADLAITYRRQGSGFGDNLATGGEAGKSSATAVRTKWVYDPDQGFEQTLAVDYSDIKGDVGVARRPSIGAVGFGGYTRAPQQDWQDIGSNLEPMGRYEQWGISSKSRWALPDFDVLAYLQYREGGGRETVDQDGTPQSVVDAQQHSSVNYWTGELQLSSRQTDALAWTVGAFLLRSEAAFDPLSIRSTVVPSLNYDHFASVTTDSIAVYAQATAAVSDQTRLTAGLRLTEDRRAIAGQRFNSQGLVIATVPPTVETPLRNVAPTWRLGIDHRLSSSWMTYASYSRGFKSGVFALSTLSNPAVEPEYIDTYEIGVKGHVFDGAIAFEGSAFTYDWRDIQLTQTTPGGNFLQNAALAKGAGLELAVRAELSDELHMNLAATALDAEFSRYPNGACFRGPNPLGGDIPEPLPPNGVAVGVAGVCRLDGNKLPRTPAVSAGVGVDYATITDFGEVGVSASYYYNDGFYWEAENRVRQPAYGLLSAQLSWAPNDANWRVRVFGQNLTDERYDVYFASSGLLGDLASPAPPRTIGITLDVRFH